MSRNVIPVSLTGAGTYISIGAGQVITVDAITESDIADLGTTVAMTSDIGTTIQAWSAVLDATTASFTTADQSVLDAAPVISSGSGAPGTTPTKVGDIYVDTTGDNVWQAAGIGSSADWKQATGAGGGDLLAANNLSDVSDAGAARTNLGLAIGTDVQAWSAVLDATTASFLIADETKLDGIEALADVTDATNVAAAGGAIISSGAGAPSSTPDKVGDIYIDTTGDLVYIATDTTGSGDWDQLGVAGSGIASIVEDDTPQLGGDLDLNGNVITGMVIGTNIQAWSAVLDATTASFTTTDETNLDAAPFISSGAGAPSSTPGKVGDIYIDTSADTIYMATDTTGSGDWDQLGVSGSGIDSVAEDPTPQLGGPLDGQGYDLNNLGVVFMTEQASAEADVPGKGQWWVRDDQAPVFTNEDGDDISLLPREPDFIGQDDANDMTNLSAKIAELAAAGRNECIFAGTIRVDGLLNMGSTSLVGATKDSATIKIYDSSSRMYYGHLSNDFYQYGYDGTGTGSSSPNWRTVTTDSAHTVKVGDWVTIWSDLDADEIIGATNQGGLQHHPGETVRVARITDDTTFVTEQPIHDPMTKIKYKVRSKTSEKIKVANCVFEDARDLTGNTYEWSTGTPYVLGNYVYAPRTSDGKWRVFYCHTGHTSDGSAFSNDEDTYWADYCSAGGSGYSYPLSFRARGNIVIENVDFVGGGAGLNFYNCWDVDVRNVRILDMGLLTINGASSVSATPATGMSITSACTRITIDGVISETAHHHFDTSAQENDWTDSATFTTNYVTNDRLTDVAHGLVVNDTLKLTTTGTLPGGTATDTLYYVGTKDTDWFTLSTTRDNANPVSLSSDGTGTHTWNACNTHLETTVHTRIGTPREITVRNWHAYETEYSLIDVGAMFNTHESGYGITFEGCKAYMAGTNQWGFNSRARKTRWVNCVAHGNSGRTVYGFNPRCPGGSAGGAELVNCACYDCYVGIQTSYGTDAENTLVKNCLFERCRVGAYITKDNTTVDGCTFINTQGPAGGTPYHRPSCVQVSSGATNVFLVNNDFTRANTPDGEIDTVLHLNSTANADEIFLRHNSWPATGKRLQSGPDAGSLVTHTATSNPTTAIDVLANQVWEYDAILGDGTVPMTGDFDVNGHAIIGASFAPVIRNKTTGVVYTPASASGTDQWTALVEALVTDVADGDVIETENISADCGASTLNIGNGVAMSVKWIAKNTVIQRSDDSDRMIDWGGGDGKTLEVIGLNLDLGESVRGAANWEKRGVGFGPDSTTGTVILRDCHFYDGPASHEGNQANLACWNENYYIYNCRFTDPGSESGKVGKCVRVKASRYVEMHGCTFDILTDHGEQMRWLTVSNPQDHPDQTIKIFGGTMRSDVGSTQTTCVIDTEGNAVGGPHSLIVDGLTIVDQGTFVGSGGGFMKIEGYDTNAVFQNVTHYQENSDWGPFFLNLSGGKTDITVRNCKSGGTFYCPNTLNKLHVYDSVFGQSSDNLEVEELTLDNEPSTAWSPGDTITGTDSDCTATIVRAISITVYKIKGRVGTFKDGEEISNGVYAANQGATYPRLRGWINDCGGGAGSANSTLKRVKDLYFENASFHGLAGPTAIWSSKDRPSWNPGHQVRYKNLTLLWNRYSGRCYAMAAVENCQSFAGTGLFIDNINPLTNWIAQIGSSDRNRVTLSTMDDTGLRLAYGKQVEQRYDKIETTAVPTPEPFQKGDLVCGDTTDSVFRIVERKNDTTYQIDRLTGDLDDTTPETLKGIELLTLNVAPGGAGWSIGDTITGIGSSETSTIVEVLSTTSYYIKDLSGPYDDGETLTNGEEQANQDLGAPVVTTQSVDGGVNSATLDTYWDYTNLPPTYGTNDATFDITPPAGSADYFPYVPGVLGARIFNLDDSNSYNLYGWIHDGTEWVEVPSSGDFLADGTVAMTGAISGLLEAPIVRNNTTQTLYTPASSSAADHFTAVSNAISELSNGDVIETVNITAESGITELEITESNVTWIAKNTKITRTGESNRQLHISGSNNVIDGLELAGGGETYSISNGKNLHISDGRNNIIRNCYFHDATDSDQSHNIHDAGDGTSIIKCLLQDPGFSCIRFDGTNTHVIDTDMEFLTARASRADHRFISGGGPNCRIEGGTLRSTVAESMNIHFAANPQQDPGNSLIFSPNEVLMTNGVWGADEVIFKITGCDYVEFSTRITLVNPTLNTSANAIQVSDVKTLVLDGAHIPIYLKPVGSDTSEMTADSGTTTVGSTSTTLVDSGGGWTTDQWIGYIVSCNGEEHAIKSNTATTLTIWGTWAVTPSTDAYTIYYSQKRDAAKNCIIRNSTIGDPTIDQQTYMFRQFEKFDSVSFENTDIHWVNGSGNQGLFEGASAATDDNVISFSNCRINIYSDVTLHFHGGVNNKTRFSFDDTKLILHGNGAFQLSGVSAYETLDDGTLLLNSATNGDTLVPGLLGYWPLNDSSGNLVDAYSTHDMTVTGSPTYSAAGVSALTNDAITWAASGEYALASTGVPTAYPFSVSLWFKCGTPGATICAWSLADASATETYHYLGVQTDGACIAVSRETTTNVNSTSDTGYDDNNWHHLVGVWAGPRSRIVYVDGVAFANEDTSIAFNAALDRTGIAVLARSSLSNQFVGSLDEVALFAKELSRDEIKWLYNEGAGRGVLSLQMPTQPEGTSILSTGEDGGTKFLREDGDGTCSWQVPAGSGDFLADGTVAMTGPLDAFSFKSQFEIKADLDNITSATTDEYADVLGHSTLGDGGGGRFKYDSSGHTYPGDQNTAADRFGLDYINSSGLLFKRQVESSVTPQMFGAIPTTDGSGADQSGALQRFFNYLSGTDAAAIAHDATPSEITDDTEIRPGLVPAGYYRAEATLYYAPAQAGGTYRNGLQMEGEIFVPSTKRITAIVVKNTNSVSGHRIKIRKEYHGDPERCAWQYYEFTGCESFDFTADDNAVAARRLADYWGQRTDVGIEFLGGSFHAYWDLHVFGFQVNIRWLQDDSIQRGPAKLPRGNGQMDNRWDVQSDKAQVLCQYYGRTQPFKTTSTDSKTITGSGSMSITLERHYTDTVASYYWRNYLAWKDAISMTPSAITKTASLTFQGEVDETEITFASDHNFDVGDMVTFSGIGGMTELNGNTYECVEAVDKRKIRIAVDSDGFTNFTSGGTAASKQPIRMEYDASNWMEGEVDTYDATTMALTFTVTSSAGSGTYAAWDIDRSDKINEPGVGLAFMNGNYVRTTLSYMNNMSWAQETNVPKYKWQLLQGTGVESGFSGNWFYEGAADMKDAIGTGDNAAVLANCGSAVYFSQMRNESHTSGEQLHFKLGPGVESIYQRDSLMVLTGGGATRQNQYENACQFFDSDLHATEPTKVYEFDFKELVVADGKQKFRLMDPHFRRFGFFDAAGSGSDGNGGTAILGTWDNNARQAYYADDGMSLLTNDSSTLYQFVEMRLDVDYMNPGARIKFLFDTPTMCRLAAYDSAGTNIDVSTTMVANPTTKTWWSAMANSVWSIDYISPPAQTSSVTWKFQHNEDIGELRFWILSHDESVGINTIRVEVDQMRVTPQLVAPATLNELPEKGYHKLGKHYPRTGGGNYEVATEGWATSGEWASGVAVAQYEWRWYNAGTKIRIYRADAAGTTGATPPGDNDNDFNDGTVDWSFFQGFMPDGTTNITLAKIVGHDVANVVSSNAVTIDLAASETQTLDLASATGTPVTVTLTASSVVAHGELWIKQDSTARDITWVAGTGITSGRWLGTEPTWISDTPNLYRVLSWFYDGTDVFLSVTAEQTATF